MMHWVQILTLGAGLSLFYVGCGGDDDAGDVEDPVCGDGHVDPDEECDGDDLGETECADLYGYSGGELLCTEKCVFDISECDCSINQLTLGLTLEDGVADSQVVPVTWEGEEGYFSIDTGSPLTFIIGEPGDPEYVPNFGNATLGCETLPVALVTLEDFEVEYFEGTPIFGVLGLDFFRDVRSEIDYPGERVLRYLTEDPDVSGTAEVSVEFVEDRVLVESTLDEQPVRLIYDAGAHHTIWVGVEGAPGDEEMALGTADGSTTTVWEGTATLTMGNDEPRVITVWRAPTFPYLEDMLEELNADGLLGVTGMGFRRIVFDAPSSALWLGPLVSP